ncbi:LysR family transcriptional regulator [Niallia taxi]|uniref:LysR family transcriptional regulator n=1 Tax=Niallia taxi TaxID=2499688 RepID=UPI0021A2886B|nr:LysR family transcriptional regulator [Niallia taxi]MCT2345840.1 LysR family transcriptional regulator [Niallia taxi]
MELLQLKYFQTVAYTEHISNAANQLNIAQPSLSLTIKRLEDELETALFNRNGRNIQLNSSGRIFLKHVDRIFIELENAQKEIQAEEDKMSHTIKIAISNPRFLAGLISDYINTSPESTIHQGIKAKSDIISSIKKGDVDLGISGHPIEDDELESCLLVEEDIVLVLPHTDKYRGITELSLSEVANEPFIALADNEEYSEFTTNLCKKHGFVPNNIFEVDSYLLLEIIKVNQGVALLPISVCRQLKLNYVKIADISPSYSVSLSWMRNKLLSSSEKSFKDFIIAYYQENIKMFKVD